MSKTKPTSIAVLLVSSILTSCNSKAPQTAASFAPLNPAVLFANVQDAEIKELSGLVLGRRNKGVFWVHNDSGDSARLFGVNHAGATVARVTISNAQAVDWEDLAIGPGPDGKTTLYIADTGDNLGLRPVVTVYRVAEPSLPLPTGTDAGITDLDVEAEYVDFAFPDVRPNCETILRDPGGSKIYFITRELSEPARIYEGDAFAPHRSRNLLRLVGQVGSAQATPIQDICGGDIAFTGNKIALRSSTKVYEWARVSGESVPDTLKREPVRVLLAPDPGGEALGYGFDGAIFTSREGANPAIGRIDSR